MANEEQAVLDFFSQEENLPLALSVAEQVDGIRRQMNNAFWLGLRERIAEFLAEHELAWRVLTTEDRNTPDCVVGLHLLPMTEQALFLRPMLEQQSMGDTLRIYYGLMWSASPAPDKTRLTEVMTLRDALQSAGFKNNEGFLAWQWSPYHPRRKDFLLRYSSAAGSLLDEAGRLLHILLLTHGNALNAANAALRGTTFSAAVSLDQLRSNLKR
jgi:hypothetical protein